MSRTEGRASLPRDACALFAKPPLAGRVKTRLVGPITADQAAVLYGAFLDDLVARLQDGRFSLRLAWALEEGAVPPSMPGLREAPLVQRGADLGARLYQALDELARLGHQRLAAVGSDQPELSTARVEEAFRELDQSDVVLGPAIDGGYYLIALRASALHPRLFEAVAWSTERVLEQTLDRCRELGRSWSLLVPEADVDTPADLLALVARLRREPGRCPRTEAVLRSWGQW